MTHTKNLTILFFLIVGTATWAHAGSDLELITIHGSEMVAHRVRVMFNEPLISESMIPPGFQLDHRFLEPDQPLSPGAFAQAPSQKIRDARRQVQRCAVLRYDAPLDPDQAARMLIKYPQVTFAEPWYTMHVQGEPNDPLFVEQEALRVIQMPAAWDISQGDASMVIAIVDNGVDQTHEDLKPSLYINTGEIPGNMIDDDLNGFVDDYNGYNFTWQEESGEPGNTANNGANGHGTNVAGIVGAATNNGKGIAGIANQCRIFPIKTAIKGSGSILYGYEAMMYAVQMGCKVINCSWGSQSRAGYVKPYSLIDKSVVDYCVAMDCMIVSSAGNHGNGIGGSGWLEFNYPSAYDGVMGVAECTTNDKVASTSGLGRNAEIIAPSTGATTTVSGGGYSSSGIDGTSFAAPMVAGAAALVRVRWPNLDPRQVATLLQVTADEIISQNPSVGKYLHGRLNVLNALQTDPTSVPGFRVIGQRQMVNGQQTDRYTNGDMLELYYTVQNDLGASAPLTCQLRILDPAGWVVQMVSATVPHDAVNAGDVFEIGPFKVSVLRYQDKPCMMDLTFADGVTNQRQFVYIEPSATMTTLFNDELSYSIGDRGLFAFGSTLANNRVGDGTGAGWRTRYEDIGWTGGLLFCTSDNKALKAFDNSQDHSDFSAEKTFTAPDPNVGILTDAQAGDREIGVRVRERCTFPTQSSFTTVIAIDIENRTAAPLHDVAGGYFFDWDIGPNGTNNRSRLAPEALPTSFRAMGEAELFYRDGFPINIVCAAVSSAIDIQGQASGMVMSDYVDDSDRFSDADVIMLLTSGTKVQTESPGDACGVVGMRFPGELLPGEHREFMIVIGVGETAEEAASNVRETILNPSAVTESPEPIVNLWPNPASNVVHIACDQPVRNVRIVDVLGTALLDLPVREGDEPGALDTRQLPTGSYHVVLSTVNGHYTQPLIIIR